MNMMRSQCFEAFDETCRSQIFDEPFGAGFDLGPDAGAVDGDIAPPPRSLEHEALALALVASFRAHSHINNVMTHISGARWDHIEHALCAILDPVAAPAGISRLEANILDLLCAERGVTGRILKPYFCSVLERLLPPGPPVSLQAHVQALHEAAQSHGTDELDSACSAAAQGSFR
ncbi:hypothetical protein [Hoeflea sp.]|uniref:hypothetical protein n=1 Tax=Hoeflea sp. TaxID=1940281 RepID=UPI0019CC856A|nr:hypothetical protein [Hoeflea sp.]MBC7281625.1 hypothetical protein [Hoeflea sp.]